MNTKHKGEISEAVIISEFLKAGITVSQTFGDNQSYDLIVDINGHLNRVQVKTGRLRKGTIIWNTISSHNTFIEKKFCRLSKSYKGKIDFFAVYCPDTNGCYLVPIESTTDSAGSLRLEQTKNKQVKGIKWAKDYILSRSLMEKHLSDTQASGSSILPVTT